MQYAERSGRFSLSMFLFAIDHLTGAQAPVDAGRLSEARVLLESLPSPGSSSARQAEHLDPSSPTVQHSLALFFAAVREGRHALRHPRKLTRLCSPKMTQGPPAGGDDNALPANGLAAVPLRPGWATLSERKCVNFRGRRGYAQSKQAGPAASLRASRLYAEVADHPHAIARGQAFLRLARFNDDATFLADARQRFDKSPQLELAPAVSQRYIFLPRMIDQLPGRIPALRAPDDETKPLLLERQIHQRLQANSKAGMQ